MSLTLTLEGKSSLLQASYMPPIELQGEWNIGLIDFHTYNSIPNVEENNNVIVVGNHIIEIPVGTYELEEINQVVNSILNERLGTPDDDVKQDKKDSDKEKDAVTIAGNKSTLKCEIKSIYDIDLSVHRTIARILGFSPRLLEKNKKHISDRPVDVLKVEDIRIECSIAAGSFDNGHPSHTIYGFYPDVAPGYKFIQRPASIIYYPITTNVISDLKIRVVDQKNRLVNFRDEHLTVRLHLKQV